MQSCMTNGISAHNAMYAMKHGDQLNYYRKMKAIHGEKLVVELERLDKTTKQFTINELLELIDLYSTKLHKLD